MDIELEVLQGKLVLPGCGLVGGGDPGFRLEEAAQPNLVMVERGRVDLGELVDASHKINDPLGHREMGIKFVLFPRLRDQLFRQRVA